MADPVEFGRVVWHDCLTHDIAGALRFYGAVAGFQYQLEHAAHCAWADGPADYPLIVAGVGAHGGFVDPCDGAPGRWLPYVAVADADAACARAVQHGGRVVRAPFDVPGVGRSAVVADPHGGLTAPFVRTHPFPPPEGVFLWDAVLADDVGEAGAFYGAVFGWNAATPTKCAPLTFTRADGAHAAGAMARPFGAAGEWVWLPFIATADVDAATARALSLGGVVHIAPAEARDGVRRAILADPMGAPFALSAL